MNNVTMQAVLAHAHGYSAAVHSRGVTIMALFRYLRQIDNCLKSSLGHTREYHAISTTVRCNSHLSKCHSLHTCSVWIKIYMLLYMMDTVLHDHTKHKHVIHWHIYKHCHKVLE